MALRLELSGHREPRTHRPDVVDLGEVSRLHGVVAVVGAELSERLHDDVEIAVRHRQRLDESLVSGVIGGVELHGHHLGMVAEPRGVDAGRVPAREDHATQRRRVECLHDGTPDVACSAQDEDRLGLVDCVLHRGLSQWVS